MIEFGVQSLSFQIRVALPLVHQSFVSHKRMANAGGVKLQRGQSHYHSGTIMYLILKLQKNLGVAAHI